MYFAPIYLPPLPFIGTRRIQLMPNCLLDES